MGSILETSMAVERLSTHPDDYPHLDVDWMSRRTGGRLGG
jgi:hypothetical protein